MKIGFCFLSIGEDYKTYTKYSRETTISYCKKYDYDFVEDENIYNSDKPIPWSKLLLILKYIDNYDYIVWIDADILIMNHDIKITDIIEKYNSFDIICGSDRRMINTGMLIVKNTDFCKQFIKDVYDNVYDPLADPNERYQNWEQGSFINLWDRNHLNCKEMIKVTEPREHTGKTVLEQVIEKSSENPDKYRQIIKILKNKDKRNYIKLRKLLYRQHPRMNNDCVKHISKFIY